MAWMRRLDAWLEVLGDPQAELARQSKHASLQEGLKHLLMAAFLFSFLYALTFKLLPGIPPETRAFGWERVFLFVVVDTAAVTLAVAFLTALNYSFARALGGKGKFATQFHLHAIILAPSLLLYYLLRLVPGIGWLAALFVLLYYAYLHVGVMSAVHRFSRRRAVVALLVPSLLIVLLLVASGVTSQAVF